MDKIITLENLETFAEINDTLKADKAVEAITGNLAKFDENGNPVDSGFSSLQISILNNKVNTLEEAVGNGGSVDERIAEECAKHYTKEETYNKTELNSLITTPNQKYVSVTAIDQTTTSADVLPAIGEANTIYRVGSWDGTQYDTACYSEYAWKGDAYIHLSTKSQIGEVFDISAYHSNTPYVDLSAALDSNNGGGVPQSLQKGGMSIKFVQSSDNKYVQYRLTSDSFNTDVFNWQRYYIDTICDVQLINECIKELYIPNSADYSTVAYFRFYAGWNGHYGVAFFDSSWNVIAEIDVMSQSGAAIFSNPLLVGSTGSAILDWNKIQVLCGSAGYAQFAISHVNDIAIKNIEYSPFIKANSGLAILNSGTILVSNNVKVNDCIKELYINGQNTDVSLYNMVRLYYGYSGLYGLSIYKEGYADEIHMYGDSSMLNSNIINHSNGLALVDWSKIQEVCNNDYHYNDIFNVTINRYITDVKYWGTLYANNILLSSEEIPIFGSEGYLKSGGLYEDLFGSVPKELYLSNVIREKGDGNITFGYDSDGRITATVGSDGIAVNSYFGFSSSNILFKANHKYKFIGLFLNNNFTLSALRGLLQVYAADGAGRLAQEIIDLKVDGNYVYVEKELQYEHPFYVTWFCIYHPFSTSEPEGATLTYLDLKIIDGDISNKSNLEGITYKRIKAISAEQIKDANKDIYQHIIDVYPDNSTPCQIANLIRGITDASVTNRYKILVHDGEYAETDIVTKDYVDIVGEHYQGAVLIHDGNATYNSPDDYSLGDQYSNVPVNTIPWNYKHLIYHMSNSSVKNITLMTIGGGCKYICHQDASYARFTAIFEHCNFVNGSGTEVLGVGANADQYFKYIGCQFIDMSTPYFRNSFNLHNWTNKDAPCGLHFEDCNFSHCGWINVSELGSGQTDYFTFLNCVCDNPNFTYFKFNGITFTETPPSYSIVLRAVGGNLGGIAVEESRQETKYMMQSQYITVVGNPNSIPFGTLLDKSNNTPAANANNGFIYKVSDIDNSGMIVVNTYGVGVGLAVAGNYAQNDEVYINNGKFTKTPNGNIAGYVIIANELSEEGYICVRAKV